MFGITKKKTHVGNRSLITGMYHRGRSSFTHQLWTPAPLLTGTNNKYRNSTFLNLIVGHNRLYDQDFDGIPSRWDCVPSNPRKHSPIIPQQLQQQRIQVPLTLAQKQAMQQPKIAAPLQQVEITEKDVQEQYKQESLKQIDNTISRYQGTLNDLTARKAQLENQNRNTDEIDREIMRVQDSISGLQQNRIRAGQYEINSLINYSVASAEERAGRATYLASPEYKNLIKQYEQQAQKDYQKQISNIESQGFKAVYANGKLTGFEDIAGGKSVPLSQFEKGYTKKEVKPSQLIEATMPKPVDTSQWSIIEPASTQRARYWEEKKAEFKERPISTILSTAGEQVSGKTSQFLFSNKYSPFYRNPAEAESIGKLTQLGAESALYFSPVGAYVMTAQGAENIIKGSSWKERAIGVGELSLGVMGIKSSIQSARTAREIAALERTPLKVAGTRFETNKGGVDFLTGTKKAGNANYRIWAEQPFIKVGNEKVILEGGKGWVIREQPSTTGLFKTKYSIMGFTSGGTGRVVGTTPRLTIGAVTQELSNVDAGMGRLWIKGNIRADLKYSKSYNPLFNRIEYAGEGKVQKIVTKEATNFLGLSKEGEGYFDIISGTAKKAKYNVVTDTTTFVSGKPNVAGRIIRKDVGDLFSGMSYSGEGRTITGAVTKTKQVPAYAGELANLGFKSVAPAQTSNILTKTLIGFGLSAQKSQVQEKTTEKSMAVVGLQNVFNIQKENQAFKIKTIQETRPMQQQREKQAVSLITPQLTRQVQQNKQAPAIMQAQMVKQEQQQRQRSVINLISPIMAEPLVKTKIPSATIPFWFAGEKKTDNKAYDSFALIDATKKHKARWVQVADNASYTSALGLGARFVDMSNLSARFKVVKDEGEIKQPENNFWSNIGYKFRNYLQRKGTKIQSGNTFYERKKYMLDSSQEKGQIAQAKASSLLMGSGMNNRKKRRFL